MRWRVSATKPAWLDPANWDTTGVLPEDMEAVPHLQRIPCGQDVAEFLSSGFEISLPETPTQVGMVLLEGVGLDDVLGRQFDRGRQPG